MKRTAAALLLILLICQTVLFSCDTSVQTQTESSGTSEAAVTQQNENGVFTLSEKQDMTQYKLDVYNLFTTLYNKKIPLLYVSMPSKAYSYGVKGDHTAENREEAAKVCEKNFIDRLDLTGIFKDSPDSYYYKNNTLVNAEGNFLIYKAVIEQIGKFYSVHTNASSKDLDRSNYKLETLKGLAPSSVEGENEDYTYLVPDFAKNMSFKVNFVAFSGKKYPVTGDFTTAVIHPDKFDSESEKYVEGLTGEALALENDQAYATVTNSKGTNKLIILHNSDDLSLFTLFVPNFSSTVIIDVRKLTGENLSATLGYVSGDIVISMIDDNNVSFRSFWKEGVTIENYAFTQDTAFYPVKDNNRQLQVAYPKSETYINNIYNVSVPNMQWLADRLKSDKTELFFCHTPFKVLEDVTVLPDGVVDDTNEMADMFVKAMRDYGINVLDLRDELKKSGMDASDFFFKTDHHWTHKAAWWGYTVLIDALRDRLGHNVDPDGFYTDLNNFNVVEKPDSYFAHFGTQYYNQIFVGLDDVTLIYPKFDTKYKFMNNQNGKIVNRSGDFYHAIIDPSTLNYESAPVTSGRYHSYIQASCPYVEITNELAPCDKSILIVKDSFSLPLIAWLSMNYKKITVYDAAQNTMFKLKKVLDEQHFDTVVMIYNPDICFYLPRQLVFK